MKTNIYIISPPTRPPLPPSPRPTVLNLLYNLARDEKLSNSNADCSPISPEESNGSDIYLAKVEMYAKKVAVKIEF